MSIVGTFPTTLVNGTIEDATQVISLFSWIQSQVNGNGCPATTTSNILKGDGSGGTVAAVSGVDYLAPNTDYTVVTGPSNTYVATMSPPLLALTDGVKIRFKASAANTGASTLNVSGLGVRPIYQWSGYPLVGGEIINSSNIEVTYNTSFNSGNGAWVIENTISQVPAGSSMRWSTSSIPAGWLIKNGQAVSRTLYAALFNIFGTTYGSGDGSTTFNLPNSTDRVNIGAGNLYGVGTTGGSKDAIVVAHSHGVSDPTHAHTFPINDTAGGGTSGYQGTGSQPTTHTTSAVATGISIQSTGSSGTDANLQPYFADFEIIKA